MSDWTEEAVDDTLLEPAAEPSYASITFHGVKTGAVFAVVTNLLLGVGAFFVELIQDNEYDGPFELFWFFAFGGSIVGSVIGAIVGLILGSLFAVTKTVSKAPPVMAFLTGAPPLVFAAQAVVNMSEYTDQVFLAALVAGATIALLLGYLSGLLFKSAVELDSFRTAFKQLMA